MRSALLSRALCIVCAAPMASGAVLAARMAYAEFQSRRDSVAALMLAARIDGSSPPARYFERLAEIDSKNSSRWLNAALEANPVLARAWIGKGLAGELAGNVDAAELDLLEAARIDRTYLPAWTLANFYFRQNLAHPFWIWAREAAQLSYDDYRGLLALAHSIDSDARSVVEKLGGGASLLHADLDYLVQRDQLEQAQEIARLLVDSRSIGSRPAGPNEAPRLIELAERQIRAGRARDALELWNAVFTPLDPGHGPVAGNQDLTAPPSGTAFDWRLPRIDGVEATWRPSQLEFALSGSQPESCTLLRQVLPLARAKIYRLRFEYITAGLSLPTGIAWDLDGSLAPDLVPAEGWRTVEVVLRPAPSDSGPLRLGALRLLYRRGPGTVRAQGRIKLRGLHMEVL